MRISASMIVVGLLALGLAGCVAAAGTPYPPTPTPTHPYLSIPVYPGATGVVTATGTGLENSFATQRVAFATTDPITQVERYYRENLLAARWSVGRIGLAGIQPLPEVRADERLVHGGDASTCPLRYVDVLIKPAGIGSEVTIEIGEVGCY